MEERAAAWWAARGPSSQATLRMRDKAARRARAARPVATRSAAAPRQELWARVATAPTPRAIGAAPAAAGTTVAAAAPSRRAAAAGAATATGRPARARR